MPWRREWQPTPVFLPGELHGQENLAGYSPWDHKWSDITDKFNMHTHNHILRPTICKTGILFLTVFRGRWDMEERSEEKMLSEEEERGLWDKEWGHNETRKGWEMSPPHTLQEELSPVDTGMLAHRDPCQTPSYRTEHSKSVLSLQSQQDLQTVLPQGTKERALLSRGNCEKRLCQETLLGRKDQNLSCCRRKWKHLLFTSAAKTASMGGSLLLWSFQHLSLRAQTPVLQGSTHPPDCGQCAAQTWADDPRVLLVSAVMLPPASGRTLPHVALFLCSLGRPAKWTLIPLRSEQTPWHWGLLHSPAACTPRGHRPGPSRHHRWCPRSPAQGSPLSRRRDRPRPPGGAVCCLRREKWDNGAVIWGMKRSSVLWDPHLSSRGRSPLRPQSLLLQTGSHGTGAAPGSGFLQKQQWPEGWEGWKFLTYPQNFYCHIHWEFRCMSPSLEALLAFVNF